MGLVSSLAQADRDECGVATDFRFNKGPISNRRKNGKKQIPPPLRQRRAFGMTSLFGLAKTGVRGDKFVWFGGEEVWGAGRS